MKSTYSPSSLGSAFVVIALLIVIASVVYTNHLANQLEEEENKKMEIWAEATRQLIVADENTDIDFFSEIIQGNTTIPVYMVDSQGNYLSSRNVDAPKDNADAYYQEQVDRLRETTDPIVVQVTDDIKQYIYYDESTLLRQLHYFPYLQFGLIFLFILVAIVTIYWAQKSEQNRVWVGLTKETAHQLGTPISSLLAWNELLKSKYPDDELLPQMDRDIMRLQTIAERFSKVGSQPELTLQPVAPLIQNAMEYMQTRSSNKVIYSYTSHTNAKAQLNIPLLEWVVENLCKNAIDAMDGAGKIDISLTEEGKWIVVDIADTGKGMTRSQKAKVFRPGFTSKKRGWGLGLSLARRIVEDYHKGRIFVLHSQVGMGTTFRLMLPKADAPIHH